MLLLCRCFVLAAGVRKAGLNLYSIIYSESSNARRTLGWNSPDTWTSNEMNDQNQYSIDYELFCSFQETVTPSTKCLYPHFANKNRAEFPEPLWQSAPSDDMSSAKSTATNRLRHIRHTSWQVRFVGKWYPSLRNANASMDTRENYGSQKLPLTDKNHFNVHCGHVKSMCVSWLVVCWWSRY